MVLLSRRRATALATRAAQRGDILLFTLLLLLLLLLGALTASREGITTTWLIGNTVTRNKDVHVADIALRLVERTMGNTASGTPLEFVASAQSWYHDVAPGTSPPTDAFWVTCLSSGTCASTAVTVNGSAVPYTALWYTQPTGTSDTTTCPLAQYNRAMYYDVFVHVLESNGTTAATTETITRVCTASNG